MLVANLCMMLIWIVMWPKGSCQTVAGTPCSANHLLAYAFWAASLVSIVVDDVAHSKPVDVIIMLLFVGCSSSSWSGWTRVPTNGLLTRKYTIVLIVQLQPCISCGKGGYLPMGRLQQRRSSGQESHGTSDRHLWHGANSAHWCGESIHPSSALQTVLFKAL